MNFAWAMKALGEGKKVTRRSLAGDPPIYLYWNKANDTIMRDYGARTDAAWKPSLDSVLAEDWEEYVEPKIDRIVCAISDIAQFADDLAEGASEQLGTKVDKRDILIAIVDAVIHADETGTPVKELVQNAYEKALKDAESNHV